MATRMIVASGASRAVWTGRVLNGLVALFVLMDGAMKVVQPEQVVEAMTTLGYSERATTAVGLLAIASVALLLIPRTALHGALLLTGFFGGAVASQLRIDAGVFPIVFPALLGVALWAGMALRDERARALFQRPE